MLRLEKARKQETKWTHYTYRTSQNRNIWRETKSKVKTLLWNLKVDRYLIREETLELNIGGLYALTLNNLSKMVRVRAQSKARKGYIVALADTDGIWLQETRDDIAINLKTRSKSFSPSMTRCKAYKNEAMDKAQWR